MGLRFLLFWFAVLLSLPESWARAPAEAQAVHRLPSITSIFPQGGQPGTTVCLESLGENLDRAKDVVFLDSWIQGRVLESYPTRLTLEFRVDPKASFGAHYFRVITPRGASNLMLFRVGDQPHQLEHERNNSFGQAEPVSIPITVNGQLNPDGDFDFYRFQAQKGETWLFDLRAARNGGSLDAVLILMDSRKRKLEHSNDYFDWDPFFAHTFAETGSYVVVVQPSRKFLDPNFAYQLDIRRAPHLQTLSPISFAPGASAAITIFGTGLLGSAARLEFEDSDFEGEVLEMQESCAHAKIHVPARAQPGEHRFVVVTEGGRSNPVSFLVDSTPAHPGGEWIRPPISITGVARYREPERFFLKAKAKESLIFEVRAHRFGSPVDSILRVLDEKGEELATNDDGSFPGEPENRDSFLSYT